MNKFTGRQHDAHIWDRTEWQMRCIYAALDLVWPNVAPAELGWNEWSRYAASGEWI